MHTEQETRTNRDLKRFVLMFYPDLAREIVEGWGHRLETLRTLTGCSDSATFVQLCRRELADACGPGFFAETMIRERSTARCADM